MKAAVPCFGIKTAGQNMSARPAKPITMMEEPNPGPIPLPGQSPIMTGQRTDISEAAAAPHLALENPRKEQDENFELFNEQQPVSPYHTNSIRHCHAVQMLQDAAPSNALPLQKVQA